MNAPMKRLNFDASAPAEMMEYILTRARQLMSCGYRLENISHSTEPFSHVTAYMSKDGRTYKTLYLAKEARGAGNYIQWHKQTGRNWPVITIKSCNIAGYLEFQKIEHLVERGPFDSTPYALIQKYYGDRQPVRAPVWLMNHIDEGLAILAEYGASPEASDVFCLHPLIQNDADLTANQHLIKQFSLENWAGAFEYRSVANEYLASRDIESIADIRLSPLECVNEALVADKIQNYKDFMLYHANHKNYRRLFNYFHNWFDALHLSTEFIVDMLTMLYDNDDMNAMYKNIPAHRIPQILSLTTKERQNRANLR